MGCLIFGGVDLAGQLEVLAVKMPAIAQASADMRTVPGRDGAYMAGNDLKPLDVAVTVRLATESIDPRDIQQQFADIVASIRNAGEQPLYLTDDRYRMAVLTGKTQLAFASYSATCDLTFTCSDPVAYGEEREVTVPSGGSVTFEVDGTRPALPVIAAESAAKDPTTGLWGLRLDGSAFVYASIASEAATHAVSIDCGKRTLRLDNAAAIPTLDSDWLELAPGEHTLAMDYGTGDAAVSFIERWL